MLLRKFRRHFGISSRKVAVQMHLAWYWRWARIAAVIGMVSVGCWFVWSLTLGAPAARGGGETLAELQERVAALEQENTRLRADLAASESALKIDAGMRTDMTRQLKTLAEEAASARDESAVLKALLAQAGKAPGVSISRFRVQRDGDGYRYRLTLVHNATGDLEFQGQLRLVANVVQDGKPMALSLPIASGGATTSTALSFKLFQPVEGTFRLPGNALLRSLEVRVFENGAAQPKATQTALVS
ncbi:MAG: hypothetical protein IOD11_20155 [Rhodocyclaceae bacterium]|nr:hypothetical protein [Rhodocyclaceae bacterium]